MDKLIIKPNNNLEGIYLDFYKNGLLRTKKNYKLGKLEGMHLRYHEYELEKKIQLAKIQSTLTQKQIGDADSLGTLSLDDRESLNLLLNKKDEDDKKDEYKM